MMVLLSRSDDLPRSRKLPFQELFGWPLDIRVALPRVNAHESGVDFRVEFNNRTLVAI